MITFLFLSAIAVAVFGVALIPVMIIGFVFWALTIPFRIVFFLVGGLLRVVFGLVGGLLGLLVAPIIMVVAGIAIVGALIVGLLSLLAPMVPVVLLGLLIWAVYRVVKRPTPAF